MAGNLVLGRQSGDKNIVSKQGAGVRCERFVHAIVHWGIVLGAAARLEVVMLVPPKHISGLPQPVATLFRFCKVIAVRAGRPPVSFRRASASASRHSKHLPKSSAKNGGPCQSLQS